MAVIRARRVNSALVEFEHLQKQLQTIWASMLKIMFMKLDVTMTTIF